MQAMTDVSFTKGTADPGGQGDNSGGSMGDGALGLVADAQAFP
jgi:hypothetical protein